MPFFRFRLEKLSFLGWAFELSKIALILVLFGVLIHLFLLTIFVVDGESMEPNFFDKEYLLIDRVSYYFRKPERGEVVILRFPGRPKEKYIKRIIGLPNEKIEIKNSEIFINNQKIKEDYLSLGTVTEPDLEKNLGENEYFVLGDNRENSSDSRIWGTCPRENIIGRAIFVLYPLSEWNLVPKVEY